MHVLIALTLVLYILAATLLWRQAVRSQSTSWPLWVVPFAAVVVHFALLWNYLQSDQFDHLNLASSLSSVALLLAALTLFRKRRSGGLLLSPIIYLFAAVTLLVVQLSPANWGPQLSGGVGLVVHVVLSLVAYAVLMLATLYAIQLLYLNHVLKNHQSRVLAGYLPPLMVVERYFFRVLTSGTLLLAVSIISGFVFLDNMLAQGQAHKTILSLIAFVLYAIVISMHQVLHMRGRPLVITSVIASFILSLAYFGSRFVKDVLLSM